MRAGELRDRLTFQVRVSDQDEYGNERADWQDQFTRAASIMPLKGGEGVISARLQGTQPALIRVRFDSLTATITPEWRAVDARDGTVYALKTAADMERRREAVTMMAEAGVPA